MHILQVDRNRQNLTMSHVISFYDYKQDGLIRADTLIRLRWYGIFGQFGAIAMVAFGFGYPMPWEFCLGLVAISVVFNISLSRSYNINQRLSGNVATTFLAIDLLHLGLLLYLTGGLQNPFAILLIAPVVVSSNSLRRRHILLMSALSVVIIVFLAFYHMPLPWDPADPLKFSYIFNIGVLVAILSTLAFTVIYTYRVAVEARKLARALAATELVMQREQHLTTLDGLATAAAHELGTPLATIAVTSKEMLHAVARDSPLREDVELLQAQADRCREILTRLTSLTKDNEEIEGRQLITEILEQAADPLHGLGIQIDISVEETSIPAPAIKRAPTIRYGLGNLLDNAVDFANSRVSVSLNWSDDELSVEIRDDGPGFSSSILSRVGEPFVTSRRNVRGNGDWGLGLGLFIAKTLLERSGASLTFKNVAAGSKNERGALVKIRWSRSVLEELAL